VVVVANSCHEKCMDLVASTCLGRARQGNDAQLLLLLLLLLPFLLQLLLLLLLLPLAALSAFSMQS